MIIKRQYIPKRFRSDKLVNAGGGATVQPTAGEASYAGTPGVTDHSQLTGVRSTADDAPDYANDIHLTKATADKIESITGDGFIVKENDTAAASDKSVFSSLRTLKEIKRRALSRTMADTASGLITFARGLVSKAHSVFEKGFTSKEKVDLEKGLQIGEVTNAVTGERKYGIDESGLAKLENITLYNGFQSGVFVPGIFGEGVQLRKLAGTKNQYVLEIQDLIVNGSLSVNEIIVKKWTYVGAGYIFSSAGFKIDKVEVLSDRYRVYPKSKEENDFKMLDQVLCQSFKTDGTSAQGKRYWRLCMGVAADRSYIDLSKTDVQGSGIPAVGDNIIQLGYRGSDNKRKGAIVISSFGDAGPYFQSLRGIDSFDLSGKTQIFIGDETIFKVKTFEIESGGGQFYRVPAERGAWRAGTYYYYDRVSHKGALWLCVAQPSTTLEPQTGVAWEKQSAGDAEIAQSKKEAEAAAKQYADTRDAAKQLETKAYADGKVTAEEKRAIADVNAKLTAAKQYADAADTRLKIKTDAYADGKVSAAEARLIKTAEDNLAAAKAYTVAQDEALKVKSAAYADGKVTAEEQARIRDVNAKLKAAKDYADAKDAELKIEQKAYADGKITKAEQAAINVAKAYSDVKKTEALAYADGKITAEEKRAIADAKAKLDAAKAYADAQVKRTEKRIDARGLDPNTYYPITIKCPTDKPYRITVARTLGGEWGVPSWSKHVGGFSLLCRWTTNGSGWGATPIDRIIEQFQYSFASVLPVGNIGQIHTNSFEYIYVRGGSIYNVTVEGDTGVSIELHKTTLVTQPGTAYQQSIELLTSVTAPVTDRESMTSEISKSKSEATAAAKAYADARDAAKQVETKAYADGKVTAEERRAINDANTKLATAKAYADAKDKELKTKTDAYADGKVTKAEQAAINVAKAYSDVKKTEALAYADGKITAEEKRAIADAKAKLDAAKAYAAELDAKLQIGTRNLINGSKKLRVTGGYTIIPAEKAVAGDEYVLSVGKTVLVQRSSYDNTVFLLHSIKDSKLQIRTPISNTRKSIVFKVLATGKTIAICATSARAGITDFYEIILTKGNKIVDYAESPEDIQARINAVSDKVADISSDNKVTPAEKQQLYVTMRDLTAVHEAQILEAERLGYSTTSGNVAYIKTLFGQVTAITTPLLANMGTTSSVNGADLRLKINNYIDGRKQLEGYINNSRLQRITKNESDLKVLPDNIKTLVKTAYIDPLGRRMGGAESTLSQLSGQISTKVSKTEYDGNKTLVNQKFSQAVQRSDEIDLRLGKIRGGVKNYIEWRDAWTHGSGIIPGWVNNGAASKNSRVNEKDPFGITNLMWKCTPDGSGEGSGGWNHVSVALDTKYAYRYSVFVRRTKNIGTTYHGCYDVDNLNGTANDNPYFWSGKPPVGQWLLLVGIIHPKDVTVQSGLSGLYDMRGNKIAAGTDFKFKASGGSIRPLSYLYYSTDPGDICYFFDPCLHRMDGTQPDINTLIKLNMPKELLDTGINLKDKMITLTADKTRFLDNSGRQVALFNPGGTKIKATAIELEGTVTANQNFKVLLDGSIEAKNGKFSGNVTATNLNATQSGRIAGLKISGNGLTNEGFNNDAYIVLRHDTEKTFVGLGSNVMPSGVPFRATSRFENEKSTDWQTNVALYAKASGARQNFSLYAIGDIYLKGNMCMLNRAFSGDAFTNTIQLNIDKYDTYVFSSSAYRSVDLPSGTQIQKAFGSMQNCTLTLKIIVSRNSRDNIALRGQSGGVLIDADGNVYNERQYGYGTKRIGKGCSVTVQYFDGAWYILSQYE